MEELDLTNRCRTLPVSRLQISAKSCITMRLSGLAPDLRGVAGEVDTKN